MARASLAVHTIYSSTGIDTPRCLGSGSAAKSGAMCFWTMPACTANMPLGDAPQNLSQVAGEAKRAFGAEFTQRV